MLTPGGSLLPGYEGGKTTGVLTRPDGTEVALLSGYDGPTRGTSGIPGLHSRIKSHVEAHAAVIMRREGLTQAILSINRIPCPTQDPRSPGCFDMLPRILPGGATLRVVGPDDFDVTFLGLPDPPGTIIKGF